MLLLSSGLKILFSEKLIDNSNIKKKKKSDFLAKGGSSAWLRKEANFRKVTRERSFKPKRTFFHFDYTGSQPFYRFSYVINLYVLYLILLKFEILMTKTCLTIFIIAFLIRSFSNYLVVKPRFVKQVSLLNFIYNSLVSYGSPGILSYMWNFGSLAGLFLVTQIITGIILAMHYTPHADLAFLSVEHIMRDVNNGWLIRYVHANGASFFFLVVYIHILRGLYYGSYAYPRQWLWGVGVIILLIMILTAFLGYVLPWGQMSFWAATVITNLASAIPLVGTEIVFWLWGGYAVDNATLNRFFSLHFLFPFIILALVMLHLALLHEYGSNNPLGINVPIDDVPLHPFYTNKDTLGFNYCFIIFFIFVAFMPNYLGHTDNYIPADPMVTPTHIVPEWYFLPFYAILRSVPNKLGGVVLLLLAIIILFLFPFFLKPYIRSSRFRPVSKVLFWFFILICLILGWIGGKPIEAPYYEIGQITTTIYFAFFLLILPIHDYLERLIFTAEHYKKI